MVALCEGQRQDGENLVGIRDGSVGSHNFEFSLESIGGLSDDVGGTAVDSECIVDDALSFDHFLLECVRDGFLKARNAVWAVGSFLDSSMQMASLRASASFKEAVNLSRISVCPFKETIISEVTITFRLVLIHRAGPVVFNGSGIHREVAGYIYRRNASRDVGSYS